MIRLADRRPPSELPERMDRGDQDPALLERALDALERVNRRFGGTRAVWRPLARALEGLESVTSRSGGVRLLDVGTGGGDMGRELAGRLRRRGLAPCLLLGDCHARTLRLARRRGARNGTGGDARYVRLRAEQLPMRDDAVDFLVCSATLHHLDRVQALGFLREADRVASRGWVVADLRRSWPAYLAVQLLAHTLWRDNPLPRVDGPRSVRRSYTPDEAAALLEDAGLEDARVRPSRPFRVAILGGAAAAAVD